MIGIISVTEKGDFIGDKLKDFFEEKNISFKGIYKSVSLRKIKKDLKCRLVTGRVRTWNKTSS